MLDLPLPESNSLRFKIIAELRQRGLTATPQAISSIVETMGRVPTEIVGDTDSILLGLLCSGSYTIDILEASGLNAKLVRELAIESTNWSRQVGHNVDVVRSFFIDFDRHIVPILRGRKMLEASDLLVRAIDPLEPGDANSTRYYDSKHAVDVFPYHLISRQSAGGQLTDNLIKLMGEFCSYLCTFLDIGKIPYLLTRRRDKITDRERYQIKKDIKEYHESLNNKDLDFCINILDHWFQDRVLTTDPPDYCLYLVRNCADLLFGPQVIADAGGNLKSVDIGLQLAQRYSPDRDLPAIAMFCEKGRIYVSEYSFRSNALVSNDNGKGRPLERITIQAARPVPLISPETIKQFEILLNNPNVQEGKIQEFLNVHKEILLSLGYAEAHPHIYLKEDNKRTLIPDYFLQIPGQQRCDIVDLKLPTVNITAKDPYLRLSRHLSKVIGQLRAYEKYFDKLENRKAFLRQFGLDAFRPGLAVIIGRRRELELLDDRVEIEQAMSGVRIYTYDDLIDYARARSIII